MCFEDYAKAGTPDLSCTILKENTNGRYGFASQQGLTVNMKGKEW